MKVLLVQPRQKPGVGFKNIAVVEPLGLEMIAAALEARHQVMIVDLLESKDLIRVARAFAPDAVGISCCFTVDVPQSLRIAAFAKSLDSKPYVFVGGHHASLSPEDFSESAVDAVVVGEGEGTAVDLASAIETGQSVSHVSGLVINTPGGQIRTPPRDLIANLDDLPRPARHLTRRWRGRYFLGFLKPTATIETSRGCPFRCSFCSVWHFYGGICRFKSAERVVSEIAEVEEPHILFSDDNFLVNVKRAKKIARLIRERGINKTYSIQARTDTIARHPEVIADWKEIGLDGVFVGLEKLDTEGLEKVAKNNTAENNEAALEVLRAHGVSVMASLIVDPDSGPEDFARIRKYLRQQPVVTPSFTVLTPLPGTDLFDQMKDRLTTRQYELFDLMHAVLPTRLDLPTFYRELANLYASAYSTRKMAGMALQGILGGMAGRRPPLRHLWRIVSSVRFFTDPDEYLSAHRAVLGTMTGEAAQACSKRAGRAEDE